MTKKKSPEFNYAVGFYWEGNAGEIGLYAYGKEHFYGTLANAQKFREYCSKQDPENKYKIFQLVELPL